MSAKDGPVMIEADAMLGSRAVEAGLEALAQRNSVHLESMSPEEQDDAIEHWRELAVDVLASARSVVGPGSEPVEGGGRAIIVLEDQNEDEVTVHVTFSPQLEHTEDGQIAGTPAQITAMSLLDRMANDVDLGDEDEGL